MLFGLFDHLDFRHEPPQRTYSDRLELIRAAEQAGFRAYHLAEHHGTPLGMAPSPSVFLAAVARETTTLRLGAMVYCLPLYHPLRLLEEICMLDQLSDGRIDVGVGRGASPFENAYFGVTAQQSVERYIETLEILQLGLRSDSLTFAGRHHQFHNVPLPLRPRQAYIPFWAAPATPESQLHAARLGMNLMVLGSSDRVREVCASYRALWRQVAQERESNPAGSVEPLLGAYRMIVVADSDREAESLARPAFTLWFNHLGHLWRLHNATTPFMNIRDFDTACEIGMVIVGCPARVRDRIAEQAGFCDFNYAVLQFAFGNLAHSAEMNSLSLFAERVMPALPSPTHHA